MPSSPVHPSATEEVRAAAGRIRSALDDGRGIAVLSMRDLLPYAADEDHLYGDPIAANPVHRTACYALGFAGADYWPMLPTMPGDAVLIVDRGRIPDTPHPTAALFEALRFTYAFAGSDAYYPPRHVLEQVATAARGLAPRRGRHGRAVR